MFFFFQAEDGIRDLVRSRGLGDVYKRQEKMRIFLLYKLYGVFEVQLLSLSKDIFWSISLQLSLIHI